MTDALFCLTAAMLGIRHGLDFDHVAAIADLIGSSVTAPASTSTLQIAKIESCRLAVMYATGHAAVVAILGVATLFFRAAIPSWIDPLMEKVVGITLIALGVWMIFCLIQSSDNQHRPRSRGALLLNAISSFKDWTRRKLIGGSHVEHSHEISQLCDWKCATSIGAIHGIGAETGTQVLLMASMAGTENLNSSLLVLTSFIFGMLISTITLALLAGEGYYKLLVRSRFLCFIRTTVALTSVVTGVLFISGRADLVPNLDALWKP